MDVVTSYLSLGLRLGRHVDGLVDAYFGPLELAEQVESEEPRDPAELVADAVELLDELGGAGLEAQRTRWLRAQLVGLETVARKLAGEQVSYEDEVERCYGIRPQRVREDVFAAAHEELDAALPGAGPLAERYHAWREGNGLQGKSLAGVVESLTSDFRDRTEALVGLPAGESIEVDYVSDEPWAAFNYYLGGLRSRIAVNTDVSLTPTFVTELIAHETYPGHHTEHTWKEELFVKQRDQPEETILLIGTPQSTIAEGIASLSAEVLLGDDEQEVTASHVAGLGVVYDAEVSRAVQRARVPLEDVPGNAAFLLHADGGSAEDAHAYLRRWGLHSEKRATQSVRFITDPVWRSYSTTYTDGRRVCRDWVAGDPSRFKRLLTEQLTPADLG
ncbi:MAG TPA: hypothetical protein VE615_08700 [Gaiellaceae bacterium]|nr:hypothetical protein [Gaiellaceae bacterium]